MGFILIALYVLIAWGVYFWWAKKCMKYNDIRKECEESGFFFAVFWIILIPAYFVIEFANYIVSRINKKKK